MSLESAFSIGQQCASGGLKRLSSRLTALIYTSGRTQTLKSTESLYKGGGRNFHIRLQSAEQSQIGQQQQQNRTDESQQKVNIDSKTAQIRRRAGQRQHDSSGASARKKTIRLQTLRGYPPPRTQARMSIYTPTSQFLTRFTFSHAH